jgi:hypothetical protein
MDGNKGCVEAQNGAVRVCKPVVSYSHHFDEEQDTDPHQSDKSDTNLHQSEKEDPDPHQSKKRDSDSHPVDVDPPTLLALLWRIW